MLFSQSLTLPNAALAIAADIGDLSLALDVCRWVGAGAPLLLPAHVLSQLSLWTAFVSGGGDLELAPPVPVPAFGMCV